MCISNRQTGFFIINSIGRLIQWFRELRHFHRSTFWSIQLMHEACQHRRYKAMSTRFIILKKNFTFISDGTYYWILLTIIRWQWNKWDWYYISDIIVGLKNYFKKKTEMRNCSNDTIRCDDDHGMEVCMIWIWGASNTRPADYYDNYARFRM